MPSTPNLDDDHAGSILGDSSVVDWKLPESSLLKPHRCYPSACAVWRILDSALQQAASGCCQRRSEDSACHLHGLHMSNAMLRLRGDTFSDLGTLGKPGQV